MADFLRGTAYVMLNGSIGYTLGHAVHSTVQNV